MRYFDINTPPPSDRMYARLVRQRMQGPLLTTPIGDWDARQRLGLLLTLLAYIAGFVGITFVPESWRDNLIPLVWMPMFAFILWNSIVPRGDDALDRMLQRPDLAPCPACDGVCDVDDDGYAACSACDHEGASEAPRMPVVHNKAVLSEPELDDAAWHRLRAQGVRLGPRSRVLHCIVGFAAVVWLALLFVPDTAEGGTPPSMVWTKWAVVAIMAAFFVAILAFNTYTSKRMRRLATRPDLVDPRTTFLPWYGAGLGRLL